MATTIIIPALWVENIEEDINVWLASKGATVLNRERSRVSWRITIQETLNGTQQTTLANIIETKFNKVSFE